MEYFNFLNKNDTICVIAPSMSCGKSGARRLRCDNALINFNKKGINIKVEDNCYNDNIKARSGSAIFRAQEFENAFLDESNSGIISVGGGELELEILSYINFNKIKKAKNKFFQGMSDNTCICFLLTTICDKASIYASNFTTFGMKKWHESVLDNFNFLCGSSKPQISFKKVEDKNITHDEGHELDGFKLTIKSNPKILSCEKEIEITGRIVGGNLDILSHICGTKFDNVKNFNKKYKDDGIIWYFESCDLNVLEQCRCIWKLKNAGWFENVKAFLIGRPLITDDMFGCNYKECNYEHLKDFNVPVIIDLDIGHIAPTWYIVNGAIANFEIKNDVAKISFNLK